MAWREVDGFRLPVSVAGDPALELCNTRAGWGEASPKEYLADLAHALALAVDLGLVPPQVHTHLASLLHQDPGPARRAYRQLLQLREDLHELVAPGDVDPSTLDRINAAMLAARRRTRLMKSARGESVSTGLTWARDWSTPAAIVDVFAEAAERLLTSEAARTVTSCPGHGCGWLFLNTSGRRRWCSMQWCGNRAKARRHANRTRSDAAAQ